MKKAFLCCIFALMFTFCLIFAISATSVLDANGNEYKSQNIHIFVDAHKSSAQHAYVNNVFYLPSNVTPGALKIKHNNGSVETVELTGKTTDGDGNTCYKQTIDGTEFTFYFANSLSSVYIKTSVTTDNLLVDKVKDEGAKTTITDKFGVVHYMDTDIMTSEIKVRGNATQNYPKLSFQLKLNNKASILGMAEAKTWILLANYDDQTLLRNSVAYKIGEILGMNTCDYRSVDVYINGEYQGIYLLSEKVQIQENRVNIFDLEEEMETLPQPSYNTTIKVVSGELINETIITEYQYVTGVKTPEDISGGYLIELDKNYYSGEKSYFKTSNGSAYVIKSPENCSKEQVEYVARLFAEMEEAIFSSTGKNSRGLHYSQYIDVDSFVYAYIVAELTRNWDEASSLYFYKDRDVNGEYSKIVKGPLWDCDNSLGNMVKNNAHNRETYWAKDRTIWSALTQHEYFNYRVSQELERVYPALIAMASEGGYIDQLVNDLGSSIVMEKSRWQSDDYTFWPLYSLQIAPNGTHYDSWAGGNQVFQFIDVYSDGVDDDDSTAIGYLKGFVEDRTKWLMSEWAPLLNEEMPSVSKTPINTLLKPPMIEIKQEPTNPPIVDTDTSTNTNTNVSTDTCTDTEINSDTSTNTSTDTSTETNTEPPNVSSDTNDNSSGSDSANDVLFKAVIILTAVSVVSIIALICVIVFKKKK